MKRQLQTATEAPPELESQDGAESTVELLNANDAALQAPPRGDVSLPEWEPVRTQAQVLPELRLLWANRRLMSYWALAGCHYRALDNSRVVLGMSRNLTSDEHLDYIAALLDDIFQIPGTKIRFGLDALIGWIPGIGDAMAGTASFLIVFASWQRGARSVTLIRMITNVLLETVVGAIPVAGDIFHVVWKANRRNYRLLMRERELPGYHAGRDWMFLVVILVVAIAAVGIPIGILIWILRLQPVVRI